MSGHGDAIRRVLEWPLNFSSETERTAALVALEELIVERGTLRGALEIIAEHSTDDGTRQLAAAALDIPTPLATVRAGAS